MIDILQNNSEEAMAYLINKVKGLKLTNFDGEDVTKVVSLMRGAMSRLGNINTKSGKSTLPDDFAETLLEVFKTSSVAEFNALSMHFSIQTQLANFLNSSANRPS